MRFGFAARGLALILVAFGFFAPCFARGASSESEQIAALQRKLDQSVQMIAALSARVQQLEAAQPAAATAPPPADTHRIAEVESRVSQIETANAGRVVLACGGRLSF